MLRDETRDLLKIGIALHVRVLGPEVAASDAPKIHLDRLLRVMREKPNPRRLLLTNEIEANRDEAERVIAAALGFM